MINTNYITFFGPCQLALLDILDKTVLKHVSTVTRVMVVTMLVVYVIMAAALAGSDTFVKKVHILLFLLIFVYS